jgi:hypothetical protein
MQVGSLVKHRKTGELGIVRAMRNSHIYVVWMVTMYTSDSVKWKLEVVCK